jgi:pimeloyl-ACP methyl ester carboxylesterase
MRARYPDREGVIDRGGVDLYYEVYGHGEPTLLLIPSAPITHSRIWKALIPSLARRYRVISLDGRGNGRSGRPVEVAAHLRAVNVEDVVAVLDAVGADQAVLVAHCHANWWAVEVADAHPDRVRALVAIAPGVPYLGRRQPHWVEAARRWEEVIDHPTGWELCNRQVIVNQHRRWIEFFFDAQLVRTALHQAVRRRGQLGAGVNRRDPRGERGSAGPRPPNPRGLRSAVSPTGGTRPRDPR